MPPSFTYIIGLSTFKTSNNNICYIRYQNLGSGHVVKQDSIIFMSHMTGLLHEGIFNVQGLTEPAIFGSLLWAYVLCDMQLGSDFNPNT